MNQPLKIVSISIPVDLYERLENRKDINRSEVCRDALECILLDKKEEHSLPPPPPYLKLTVLISFGFSFSLLTFAFVEEAWVTLIYTTIAIIVSLVTMKIYMDERRKAHARN